MNKISFDKIASDYDQLLADNLGVYGKELDTVASILKRIWTGRTFPFILPVQHLF